VPLPLKESTVTIASSLRPSCLVSCSQPSPSGGSALGETILARLRLRPTRHVAAHTKFDTFASSLATQAKLEAKRARDICRNRRAGQSKIRYGDKEK
jgi:hypothetical protein